MSGHTTCSESLSVTMPRGWGPEIKRNSLRLDPRFALAKARAAACRRADRLNRQPGHACPAISSQSVEGAGTGEHHSWAMRRPSRGGSPPSYAEVGD